MMTGEVVCVWGGGGTGNNPMVLKRHRESCGLFQSHPGSEQNPFFHEEVSPFPPHSGFVAMPSITERGFLRLKTREIQARSQLVIVTHGQFRHKGPLGSTNLVLAKQLPPQPALFPTKVS